MSKKNFNLDHLVSSSRVEPAKQADHRLSFNCDAGTYTSLRFHAALTGLKHQEILETALAEYLEKHAKP